VTSRGGVTSRAGDDDVTRGMMTSRGGGVTSRGEGGSAARAMDEGVRAEKGVSRRERWTRGSARGRGIRGKKTVRRCEKDSATCGKRIALSV